MIHVSSRVALLYVFVFVVHELHGQEELIHDHVRRRRTDQDAYNSSCFKDLDESWQPPNFVTNCPPSDLDLIYVVPKSADDVIVTWSEPVARDYTGTSLSTVQVVGDTIGSRFSGGTDVTGRRHDIVYIATDNKGLSTSCYFSFSVKVLACPSLPTLNNGHVRCSNQTLIGSSCQVTCDLGHVLSGPGVVTCTNSSQPTWSTIPTCEKVVCRFLPSVLHGSLICEGNSHLSYCTVSCDAGYTLEGPVYTICQADGSWSTVPRCKDATPPSIICQSPQTVYAHHGQSSALARWTLPTSNDDIDSVSDVIQTSGPTVGTSIPVGTSVNVTFTSEDDDGNTSPECVIELRAQAISCGHPRDLITDGNVTLSCTMTSFTWGDVCTLGCQWNLSLEGSNTVTCERSQTGSQMTGNWSWGPGDPPYCRHVNCPALDQPLNGYLDNDTINNDPVHHVKCVDSGDVIYRVPDMGTKFNGLIICHDDRGWEPYQRTPDCIVPGQVNGFSLASELHYYTGSCSQTNTFVIREVFLDLLSNVTSQFQVTCPSNSTCVASNPVVSCSNGTRRRRSLDRISREMQNGFGHSKRGIAQRKHDLTKRQTSSSSDTLIVSFNIDVFFNTTSMNHTAAYTYADSIQLEQFKPLIQGMVEDGGFNLPGWSLRNDSFTTAEYGDETCEAGYRHVIQLICHPCPVGYILENNVCVECPIGQYNNVSGAVSCSTCPDGFSTRHTGAKYITDCIKLCSPGTYSPDKFEPCALCQPGYYQPGSAQTSCLSCPPQQMTIWPGKVSEDSCQDFDVLLESVIGVHELSTLSEVSNITISMWLKLEGHKTPRSQIKLGHGSADVVKINITNDVHVSSDWFPELNATVGSLLPDLWLFLAVTIDVQHNSATVYFAGDRKVSVEGASNTNMAMVDARLSVTSDGEGEILLSGFRVLGSVLNRNEISETLSSCHSSDDEGDLLHMGLFKRLSIPGISVMVPSKCHVLNHCLNSPCGTHTCINGELQFTCLCHDNWSGATCHIPPHYCTDNACRNNGTCINGETNYTCNCGDSFSGLFCETQIATAESWSDWSSWTDCSVTCNNGTRARTRVCKHLGTGSNNAECTGKSVDTQECNTTSCPGCPTSPLDSATNMACATNITAGLQCIAKCRAGYRSTCDVASNNFRCGLVTGYIWMPSNRIPDCILADTVTPAPGVSSEEEQDTDMTIYIGVAIAGLLLTGFVVVIVIIIGRRRKSKQRAASGAYNQPNCLGARASNLSEGLSNRASNAYAELNDIRPTSQRDSYDVPVDRQAPPPYAEIGDVEMNTFNNPGQCHAQCVGGGVAPPPYTEHTIKEVYLPEEHCLKAKSSYPLSDPGRSFRPGTDSGYDGNIDKQHLRSLPKLPPSPKKNRCGNDYLSPMHQSRAVPNGTDHFGKENHFYTKNKEELVKENGYVRMDGKDSSKTPDEKDDSVAYNYISPFERSKDSPRPSRSPKFDNREYLTAVSNSPYEKLTAKTESGVYLTADGDAKKETATTKTERKSYLNARLPLNHCDSGKLKEKLATNSESGDYLTAVSDAPNEALANKTESGDYLTPVSDASKEVTPTRQSNAYVKMQIDNSEGVPTDGLFEAEYLTTIGLNQTRSALELNKQGGVMGSSQPSGSVDCENDHVTDDYLTRVVMHVEDGKR